MIFACYQGRSVISSLIRRFTRSRYSHVALQFDDGTVIEAIGTGVVRAASLSENHDPGTVVDLFDYVVPLSAKEEHDAREFAESLIGRPYDYASILVGFTMRTAGDAGPRGEFCSEVALSAGGMIGRPLQRMMPWRATPDHVAISPVLKWKKSITL